MFDRLGELLLAYQVAVSLLKAEGVGSFSPYIMSTDSEEAVGRIIESVSIMITPELETIVLPSRRSW